MRDRVTTITVLTPAGRGAVASVSVDGPQAVSLVQRSFLPASGRGIEDRPLGRIVFGRWICGDVGPGEELVVCRLRDDVVEVHCHGGVAAVEAIAGSLVRGGAIRQGSDAWAHCVSGNFIQAQAHLALANASSERTALILLDQFHGALQCEVMAILALLEHADLALAARRLSLLIESIPVGLHLTTPWRIAISGPPNVGKSSLMNALVGYSRSIVFDQPGTTRDSVTAHTAFDGWPMQLIDTAGLRQTDDPLESAGIDQALRAAHDADLELLICDATNPLNAPAEHDSVPRRILVVNKVDLIAEHDVTHPGVKVSATTGAGLPQLIHEILSVLVGAHPSPGDPLPFTQRQAALLREASCAVESASIKNAADCLRRFVG